MTLSSDALTGRRLLVVDDSKPMRLLTSRLLELAGARVDVAEDGEQGFNLTLGEPYDALVIDIEMPGIDGCVLATRIRAAGNHVAMIAVTAHQDDDQRQRCLGSGFAACVTKPFSQADLLQALEPLLRQPKL